MHNALAAIEQDKSLLGVWAPRLSTPWSLWSIEATTEITRELCTVFLQRTPWLNECLIFAQFAQCIQLYATSQIRNIHGCWIRLHIYNQHKSGWSPRVIMHMSAFDMHLLSHAVVCLHHWKSSHMCARIHTYTIKTCIQSKSAPTPPYDLRSRSAFECSNVCQFIRSDCPTQTQTQLLHLNIIHIGVTAMQMCMSDAPILSQDKCEGDGNLSLAIWLSTIC